MRRWLVVTGLLGSLALTGCGASDTSDTSGAADDAITAAADSGPVTDTSGLAADRAVLTALCEQHCASLSLDGISMCESGAECDANVAEAHGRLEALVDAAAAEGLDITAAPAIEGPIAVSRRAHEEYGSTQPCRDEAAGEELSSTCFAGVADYLVTVQLVGMNLERNS